MRDIHDLRREKIDDLIEERYRLLAEVEQIEKELEQYGVTYGI